MNEPLLYALADTDGRIVGVTEGPYYYLKCDDTVSSASHYVDTETHTIHAKTDYIYDVETSGLEVTITGLPPNVGITVNGISGMTDNEPTVVSFDLPGTYTVKLDGTKEHLPTEFEVTVDDPDGE